MQEADGSTVPVVVTHSREAGRPPPSVPFDVAEEWVEKQVSLDYKGKVYTAQSALMMTSPLHPFAHGPVGRRMLFHTSYVQLEDRLWVDARLLKPVEAEAENKQ